MTCVRTLSYHAFVDTNPDAINKPALQDWHKADIKCALEKRGYTFSRLSRLNGYAATSLQMVVHVPWPKAETLVANVIGVTPQEIWPSRYNDDGTPKRGEHTRHLWRLKRKASRPPSNHSTAGRLRNAKERQAA